MQGFSGGKQLTEPDSINKENSAVSDSAKLIELDTEEEVALTNISNERSITMDSAEPGARTRVPGVVSRLLSTTISYGGRRGERGKPLSSQSVSNPSST